ncbi:MAG: hypothetical protein K2O88_09570, partial [Paramuribaculum sp.]|nr:hypothetical protein [Paramuribaculum sp.]
EIYPWSIDGSRRGVYEPDGGQPIALADTLTAHAFMHLAHEVTDAVAEREATLPPTIKVNVTKK